MYVYYREHGVPHFHAVHAGRQVVIAIEDLAVLDGRLSPRSMGLVMEWAAMHQEELMQVWREARAHEPLSTIEPLQ